MSQPVWTLYVGDLLSDPIQVDCPFNQTPTYGRVLNGAGSFTGQLKLTDARAQRAKDVLMDCEGKTSIWIDRDGSLDWGGIGWTTAYDSYEKVLTIGGADMWSYFDASRLVTWDVINTDTSLNLAQSIIEYAQDPTNYPAGATCNIGVTVVQAGSGAPTIVPVISGDQYTQVGQAFDQLAEQSGGTGFDYIVEVEWSGDPGSVPVLTLVLSFPRRGRAGSDSPVVLDLGSPLATKYLWNADGTAQANSLYGVGGSSSSSTETDITDVATDSTAWAAGFPLLEANLSRTDVLSSSILDSLTAAQLAVTNRPVKTPSVIYGVAGGWPLDPTWDAEIGDDVRLIIPADEYFEDGYDSNDDGSSHWRMVATTVGVNDDGESTFEIDLALPPVIEG